MIRLMHKIQNDPPSAPEYEYHWTQEGTMENVFPSVSHVQDASQWKCKYSKPIQ